MMRGEKPKREYNDKKIPYVRCPMGCGNIEGKPDRKKGIVVYKCEHPTCDYVYIKKI